MIITVTNRKGGVAKTTTVANVAAVLAAADYRVLVLDLDDQENLTQGLSVGEQPCTIADYLLGGPLEAVSTSVPNVMAVGGSRDLAHIDESVRELLRGVRSTDSSGDNGPKDFEAISGHFNAMLKSLAERFREHFDHIVIDTPPDLNALTLAAIRIADTILVPVQCAFFAITGVEQTLEAAAALNPSAAVRILRTLADPRTRHSREASQLIENRFGDRVFQTIIRRAVAFDDSSFAGEPLVTLDARSDGARAYMFATAELLGVDLNAIKAPREVEAEPLREDLIDTADT